MIFFFYFFFFFSSRRRHTRWTGDWSSDVCSSDLFRPCVFLPTFQKHAGKGCGGVQIHVTDRQTFKPAITGIAVVKTAFDMYRDEFRWKDPPYEYEYDRNPFDLIAGTDKVREAIERGDSVDAI